jgi:uncharacterized protein
MAMLGTIVNSLAIVAGGLLGLLLKKQIPDQVKASVTGALGLSVLLIGLTNALRCEHILLLIVSMTVGSAVGGILQLERSLERFGLWLESRTLKGNGNLAQGFVTATLVYCVGAMAIVGSLESGLTGNHQTLFAKSLIDGLSAIIFASTLGVGVLLSAVSVLVYQGTITIAAGALAHILVGPVISNMSAIGGLLIAAIGINILDIKRIPVANMVPAIFVPLYQPLVDWIF